MVPVSKSSNATYYAIDITANLYKEIVNVLGQYVVMLNYLLYYYVS